MRARPLEMIHRHKEWETTHDVPDGSTDYDIVRQLPSGEWFLRFAMGHLPEEEIPHGSYRLAVRAHAAGFQDAIGHFDAWEGLNGRLCFNMTGRAGSIGEEIAAALDQESENTAAQRVAQGTGPDAWNRAAVGR